MTQQVQVLEHISPTAPELTAKFFRGLGDATRVKILYLLLEGDKNVGELVEMVGSSQGRVSSHLACLRWCGYVISYRDGKNVYYTIADPRVKELLELSRHILTDNAERIIACQIIG
ncbi:MAG: winged helix-turn-helix transcriptional regulator [Chloroflexi bacterium]|nr:winged helix-turn-helix transcriptional regulator [Chloroflexota bacterium]